jgi:hypothetical protein
MATDVHEATGGATAGAAAPPQRRGVWGALTGAVGAVMGILPHVLHHIGPLVGAAILTGAGGTLAFGLLGLALSVPMLLRLKRRFGTWWAPALGVVAFTALFLLSALVIGPAISGQGGQGPASPTEGTTTPVDDEHAAHHD